MNVVEGLCQELGLPIGQFQYHTGEPFPVQVFQNLQPLVSGKDFVLVHTDATDYQVLHQPIPLVYNDVFRWLNEQSLQLPSTVDEALSQHLAVEEGESKAPHLDGSLQSGTLPDDPGFWGLEDTESALLEELKSKLEAELLPEFTRVRLL